MGRPIIFCARTSKGFFVKIKRYLVFIGVFSFFGGRPYFTHVFFHYCLHAMVDPKNCHNVTIFNIDKI
jgi:hypothetical protein